MEQTPSTLSWTQFIAHPDTDGCEGINLDGFPNAATLWEFWKATNRLRPLTTAKALFPSRPKGYVRVTKDLGHYAANKATAMGLRQEGRIDTALMYERICESIYDRLPGYARW